MREAATADGATYRDMDPKRNIEQTKMSKHRAIEVHSKRCITRSRGVMRVVSRGAMPMPLEGTAVKAVVLEWIMLEEKGPKEAKDPFK